MIRRLILSLIALAALAATKPAATTRSSAKPPADSRAAPNPAAVVTDVSNERAPATQGATRTATTAPKEKIASTRTSVATTAATQPESKPVPLLSAEEAAKTFNLPPGFRAEVVAAEPLVQQPVAMEFDPDGRLWVVEMRGYMPTVDGKGEDEPNGRITILEDLDGDGAMDKRTIFLDQLVMPRSLGLVNGGALVGVPPRLLFVRDTDGDMRADDVQTLFEDYGDRGNPEHQANGPLYGIDNWIYNSNYGRRLRYVDHKWVSAPVPTLGQWGLSQDDFGRLFHDTNSDHLRGSAIAPHYASRNPNWIPASADTQIDNDQNCWPAHPSAVNRGYREGFLRDGRLAKFTAACGPVIYRGDLFPEEFRGNAFVCEPSANLVRRTVLKEKPDGSIEGENAYKRREFIASTYERFRPVNCYNGPDGALYVVDMHHGLLQHRQYLTDYAKKLYLDRDLDQFLLTGRIYRIVPDGSKPVGRPRLSRATTPQLVKQLSHPNGWWRDTAQRLLVERRDPAATKLLRATARSNPSSLARIHALWTLEGLSALDVPTAQAALRDEHPRVRAAAIRASEALLAQPRRASRLLAGVLKLADDDDVHVRLQFVLSTAPLNSPDVDEAIDAILRNGGGESYVLRDAAISGMRGRELSFLRRIMDDPQWSQPSAGRHDVITDYCRAIIKSADRRAVAGLLDLLAEQSADQQWRQLAMLEAFPEPDKSAARRRRSQQARIALDAPPTALMKLSTSGSNAVRARLDKVDAMFTWPGKPLEPAPKVEPLTPQQQARFERGRVVYTSVCGQCHKPDGMGQVGLAPPLVNSEFVLGPDSRLSRIVMQGLRGPIEVQGKQYNLDMPGLAALDDEQIAAVLTYIRREWGHAADPVEPKAVKDVRGATSGRREAWTAKELEIFH
jgi:mono/diheme cytochrome c family protein/glucose/arabinose dehydrogenase